MALEVAADDARSCDDSGVGTIIGKSGPAVQYLCQMESMDTLGLKLCDIMLAWEMTPSQFHRRTNRHAKLIVTELADRHVPAGRPHMYIDPAETRNTWRNVTA